MGEEGYGRRISCALSHPRSHGVEHPPVTHDPVVFQSQTLLVEDSRSTRPSGTTNEEKTALSIDRRGRVQKKKLKTQQTYPWPDDDTRFLDLRTISGFTPKLSSFYGTRSASLPILTD